MITASEQDVINTPRLYNEQQGHGTALFAFLDFYYRTSCNGYSSWLSLLINTTYTNSHHYDTDRQEL